jgi:beta propeller repeat protein
MERSTKMKAAAVVLLAVILAALIVTPAASQAMWQEQLVLGESWAENDPKMWGSTIYYADHRAGYPDVYAYDPLNGSRPIIQGPRQQYPEAVYEDKLVYSDYRTGTGSLYLWDQASGSQLISSSIGPDAHTSIYGDLVVWEDYRAGLGNPRVYMWDPMNGETRISSTETSQTAPKVWGNRVIWQEGSQVRTWSPDGGASQIGSGNYSAVYQDRVVIWQNAWTEPSSGGYPGKYHPGFLKEWTPETGLRTILEHDKTTSGLELWGDLVVLSTGAWDPVHGFSYYIEPGHYVNAYSLYGNQVAWVSGDNNIFLSTMIPEPSSLFALAVGLGALAGMLRRRTTEGKR